MSKSLQERYESSPLFGGNAPFVEHYYEEFLRDPSSVPEDLRAYFESLGADRATEIRHTPIRATLAEQARTRRPVAATGGDTALQAAVSLWIDTWRRAGHQLARLDPLGMQPPVQPEALELSSFGLDGVDPSSRFHAPGLLEGGPHALADIEEHLKRIYSGPIALELDHVNDGDERRWLQERFDALADAPPLTTDERRELLLHLTGAEGIERYLHTRYVGQKRFSLEGGECLIPLLDNIIQRAGADGVAEIVIGMAHRGRINVLVNVLGKSPKELFSEFEGAYDPATKSGSGDVKYHMGFSSDIKTPGGNIHLALAFNPSHLEIVNPVVEGSVRARQDRRGDSTGELVMPVLVHGDAAFAGQGVVTETLQLSATRGFTTGGTLHVVCNNQVGFTTSNPEDARSTPYCSDVAKMVEAPVLHVNGDEPEAVLAAGRLALEYRKTFHRDVVIDMVCYRRHGHNEADEPAATQPTMYQVVRKLPTVRQKYADELAEKGALPVEESRAMVEAYREGLDEGRIVSQSHLGMIGNKYTVDWTPYDPAKGHPDVDTSISPARASALGERIVYVPEDHTVHPRVARIMADRDRMRTGDLPLDWGYAETLAYASLLTEGIAVRLTGQDSGRGTFFHRHAVLHDQHGGEPWIPLENVAGAQRPFRVTDSLLSEEAVLGFEYGYSTTDPVTLVIWEGQFGDFVNGAQVVIDQFISSGEAKWQRYCGLTLFLPHGYEGQGPEHSSARLERFLQLCAEHNMQVCVPSTPAQMFHMLRRQMLQGFRRPLIVMTPKSLLRHRLSTSSLEDITSGRFHHVIPEVDDIDPKGVRRVVFCSGKVYYDLLEARRSGGVNDVAVLRVEQLYPFPIELYAGALDHYSDARDIVWCQEEPENQGAWYQIRHRLQEPLGPEHRLIYAGREHAAAPASGYFQQHVQQQQKLVEEALGQGQAAEAGKTVSAQ